MLLLLLLVAACSGRPEHCDDYDEWARAANEVNRIEARIGLDEWSPSETARWKAALNRQSPRADRPWNAPPADATWQSVKSEPGQPRWRYSC